MVLKITIINIEKPVTNYKNISSLCDFRALCGLNLLYELPTVFLSKNS
jgi:hypothetical protein